MADPRDRYPDPESAPAAGLPPGTSGPVTTPATPPPALPAERAAIAAEPPPVRAPGYARVLSALLPGAGHLVLGAWARGMLFLLPWGVLLGLLYWTWDRVAAVPRTGTLDDWIALAALALAFALLWGYALHDLAGARARRAAAQGDSQWRIAARHFRRNRPALAGLALIGLLYAVALLAPLIAPYDPIAQNILESYRPPSAAHWLGTDRFGRDILTRILFGARISLSIAFVATGISITLGTLLGAVAGYFGGRVDSALMRFTDMVLSFPRLVLLLLVVALFSPSITVIIIVLGLTQWPSTTRIVRGDVLSLREREFIQAARALGMSRTRIIARHLIPNVLAPVIVSATLGIGNTIVFEAGLSFLGLGVQPPTPSWGNMVADGRDNLLGAWWVATFPGLVIVFTVLAFNLVGDGLRDALDPRLRT